MASHQQAGRKNRMKARGKELQHELILASSPNEDRGLGFADASVWEWGKQKHQSTVKHTKICFESSLLIN